MTEFVAFDKNAEVYGESILMLVEALGEKAHPVLKKHGLANIQAGEWYALQTFLNAFKDIAIGDLESVLNLVSIGMRVPDIALWPPHITTIEEALFSIDAAYQMNHRNGDIGHYQASITGEREITIHCKNPYPSDFDYGIIHRVASQYKPQDGSITVLHKDDQQATCRKKGGDTCTYVVSW